MVLQEKSEVMQGTYNIYIKGCDWGPAVYKAVVTFNNEIKEISKDMFEVEEIKSFKGKESKALRIVTDIYLSDAEGRKTEKPSNSAAIELKIGPEEGSPFVFNEETDKNNWACNYSLKISLKEGKKLKISNKELKYVNIRKEYVDKFLEGVDKFKEKTYESAGDISMKYACYEPEKNNEKRPLIIWLHGSGEGGEHVSIALLGNKVLSLAADNIQKNFKGAYVLAPQCPTNWMDSTGNNNYAEDGTSIYISSLLNLIKSYVSSKDDIDTERIYIGGCSAGGYMTMALLFKECGYFAAAYPICEAYKDSCIEDDKITYLKDMPIWFTYAENDNVVNPSIYSVPTIKRLKDIGNKKIHSSVFKNVIDTSGFYKNEKGDPYEYEGHLSWIYAFNDECKDEKESLWSWLSKQKKGKK